jgi:hypothetical protein
MPSPMQPNCWKRNWPNRATRQKTIALGANTDPYQPIERTYRITLEVLEVLERTNHPVGIVTKSALVTRDIDILSRMAKKGPCEGRNLDHHARQEAGPADGAARCNSAAATGNTDEALGGRHSDRCHGRTDSSLA